MLKWILYVMWAQQNWTDIIVMIFFMIVMMIIGTFSDLLHLQPVVFTWLSVVLAIIFNHQTPIKKSIYEHIIMQKIPIIAFVWVNILWQWIFYGVILTVMSGLIISISDTINMTLCVVFFITTLPLIMHKLIIGQMLGHNGVIGIIILCPLLTPLLIFGIGIMNTQMYITDDNTLIYAISYVLFCIATLPYAATFIIKERITT